MARTNGLYQTLHSLPKVDLHRHLEGSIRAETFLELVPPQADAELPTRDPEALRKLIEVQPDEAPSFMNFLSKFALLHNLYTDPAVFGRIVREAVEDAARDNVVHLELRVSLRHLTRRRGFAMRDVLDWLHEARVAAEREFAVSVALLPMLNREGTREQWEQVMDAVLAQPDGVIAGVDLAGDELHYPLPPVADLFERARERGMRVDIHAGEARGADVVDACLRVYEPDRIGHGVQAVESADTLERLAERGIPLQVCPTSNLQTGATARLADHQLRRLRDAGVNVTLNTDDPGISRTTLTREYMLAAEQIGMPLETLKRMNLAAARAAYLPPERKARLIERIEAAQ